MVSETLPPSAEERGDRERSERWVSRSTAPKGQFIETFC